MVFIKWYFFSHSLFYLTYYRKEINFMSWKKFLTNIFINIYFENKRWKLSLKTMFQVVVVVVVGPLKSCLTMGYHSYLRMFVFADQRSRQLLGIFGLAFTFPAVAEKADEGLAVSSTVGTCKRRGHCLREVTCCCLCLLPCAFFSTLFFPLCFTDRKLGFEGASPCKGLPRIHIDV